MDVYYRVHNKFLVAWDEGIYIPSTLKWKDKIGSILRRWYVFCVCIDDMSLTLELSMQMMLIFLIYKKKSAGGYIFNT